MSGNWNVPGRVRMFSAVMATISCLTGRALEAAEPGMIKGRIVDRSNQVTTVGNAVVFLLDAETGLPMVRSTRAPFAPARINEDDTSFWAVETQIQGEFEFQDVPPGRYRLVAQSWSGTSGMPPQKRSSGSTFLFDHPSTTVTLLGVAEDVEVKSGETTESNPKALGDGVLKIVNDPEEDHAFLLVSLKPRLGPGVLGPAGWGTEFLTGLIGYTQMEDPYVTLVGLPDGAEIHVGLFNYDNNPGVGGDTFKVGAKPEVRLEIFATWSNGKSEPPPELLPLTNYLDSNNLSVESVLGLTGTRDENRAEKLRLLRDDAGRKVRVGNLGEFRIADILAACQHRDLRKAHRERKERQK